MAASATPVSPGFVDIDSVPTSVAPTQPQEAKKVDAKVAKQLGFKCGGAEVPLVGGAVGVSVEFAKGGKPPAGNDFKPDDLEARFQRLKVFVQDSKEGPGVVTESGFNAMMVDNEESVAILPIVSVEGLPNMPAGKCVGSGSLKLTKMKSTHRLHIHITTSDNQMSASESVASSCCFGVQIFARYTASQDITSHAFVTNVEDSVHHSHFTVKNVARSVREIKNPMVVANQNAGCCASFKCCDFKCCGCDGCVGSMWTNSAAYSSAMELQAAASKLEAGQSSVQAKFPEVQEMQLQQKHARSMTVQQELTMVLRQSAHTASRCVVTFDAHTGAEDIMRFSSMLSVLASPGPDAGSISSWKVPSGTGGLLSARSTCSPFSFWMDRSPFWKKNILSLMFFFLGLFILSLILRNDNLIFWVILTIFSCLPWVIFWRLK